MDDDISLFRELLAGATAGIGQDYYLLPVADGEGGEPLMRYRERVYAYELYHQLRVRWPAEWEYSLAGEVDKRGHPLVRGGLLDNAKPDLLVHIPGRMINLAAIEIKPLRPDRHRGEDDAFQRDIKKLLAFRDLGYVGSIFLAFGESLDRLLESGHVLRQSGIPIDEVELFHHRQPGQPAIAVGW